MTTKPNETIAEELNIDTAFERMGEQESAYRAMIRRAELCRIAGQVSAVSALVAAGEVMRTSEFEKQYLNWRVLTGVLAVGTAFLGNLMGKSQSEERIQTAGVPAGKAAGISQELGIDLPQWSIQGIRNAAGIEEANRQMRIRNKV